MGKTGIQYVRRTEHVRCFGDVARLRWFGHIQRRDSKYVNSRILRLQLADRRSRGRQRKFMDVEKIDMKLAGLREEDAGKLVIWEYIMWPM